jgi:hypothetical protein
MRSNATQQEQQCYACMLLVMLCILAFCDFVFVSWVAGGFGARAGADFRLGT